MSTAHTTANRFKITEIVNGPNGHEFEIHSADCADLRKSKYQRCPGYTWNVKSIDGYIAGEVADYEAQDQGWTAEHFHVHGCARKAEKAAQADSVSLFEVVAEATYDEATDEVTVTDAAPEPGTPEAARVELDRRAHNKAVKKTGEGVRIEAASDWAFQASTQELKALAA